MHFFSKLGPLAILLFSGNSLFAVTTNTAAVVKVAICQILVIDSDREGNFRRIEYALADAKAQGAQIAAFPESAILGWENPVAHRLAEPIPGADSNRIQDLARKFDLMIALGLDEKDGDRLYDSAILVDRTGKLRWKHRKINVLPELMSPPYSQGSPNDINVIETEFGRIAFLICADTFSDVHFERIKALKPDFMIVPYGWAAKVQEWPEHAKELEKIVSKRARELGCDVVGTDLVGVMSAGPWKGYTYGGASVAISATGDLITKLRDRDVEVRVVDVHPRTH
ncbi:MAG TPA: carbon-nitrogen hydrolase family protein [Candidatus Sulfotelmatobacter sp.]|nr:carbon-nitrogen hydrolase family protein [Candidatus Sulfotelmatobacter sp.]